MKPDKLFVEARARIIWGESSSSICDFLTSNGVPSAEAAVKVGEFSLERDREVRRIGFRSILIGAVIIGISIGPICIAAYPNDYGSTVFKRAFVFGLVAALYGLWKLLMGVIYIALPKTVRKSIPDIGESDPLD